MKINSFSLKFLSIVFLICFNAFAQEFIKHKVVKGETITQISQKYRVTPFDIYSLNPKAEAGIKENDILNIPSKGNIYSNTPAAQTPINAAKNPATHTAKAKETLFSIARIYNVSVGDLRDANPILNEGLKIGQIIKIPGGGNTVAMAPKNEIATGNKSITNNGSKPTVHIVVPHETKFGISKKYGMTVAELERLNPGIITGLPVGYRLSINGGATGSLPAAEKTKPAVTEINSIPIDETEVIRTVRKEGFANYEVKPKETMYSLTQMFDITEAELVRLNPNLKDGLQVGMILKVPGRGSFVPSSKSGFVNLAKSVTKQKRTLVMLLPFNADKIQGDTLKSLSARLKKDAFLNMTLDFYSGAKMAIDSAKTLGINFDVKIYDSQESKSSSDVENIVRNKNLKAADAIIGPFYQQYAEKVAELLAENNVPVISPLSKEDGKGFPNLYQAMPTSDYSKKAIFDHMIAKNGNVIIVADPKRAANRDFITRNYPEVRFVTLTENGGLIPDNLRAMFVKDKMNYVVLDSEKTGMILGTTNVLLNEMANHQMQLAIIEPNETLDFEEISMKRLTILQLLYPSQTRENNTPQATIFENAYKRENKIFPSQYAVRGFDITFDTILRMAQEKGFAASANEDVTEQVESKFKYAQKDTEGFINKGVYILQYEENLSVKEAN